jgi:hypothetical protein
MYSTNNRKFQAPKTKSQINSNDQISKFQTGNSSADAPNGSVSGETIIAI